MVRCEFCGKTVAVLPPPTSTVNEPYPGSRDPRLERHESVWRAPKE
jgi:hypothetical protein